MSETFFFISLKHCPFAVDLSSYNKLLMDGHHYSIGGVCMNKCVGALACVHICEEAKGNGECLLLYHVLFLLEWVPH